MRGGRLLNTNKNTIHKAVLQSYYTHSFQFIYMALFFKKYDWKEHLFCFFNKK